MSKNLDDAVKRLRKDFLKLGQTVGQAALNAKNLAKALDDTEKESLALVGEQGLEIFKAHTPYNLGPYFIDGKRSLGAGSLMWTSTPVLYGEMGDLADLIGVPKIEHWTCDKCGFDENPVNYNRCWKCDRDREVFAAWLG